MNHSTVFVPSDAPSTGKPCLLLVEDEHSYALFLQELLAEEYTVEVTSNGEEAWMEVQRRLPDLILSDVQMPLLNGLDFTRRLRADPRTAGVPIVLMTASNQKEVLLAALDAGMDEFLVKPFHPMELLARLRCQRRLIELRREASAHLARGQVVAVEQARYRFLSSLGHELRTPLTPVQFGLHLLDRTRELPASAREVLAMIRRNVDTEVRLINDLLDVSQLLHGKLALNVAPVDLHSCLGEALNEARESFADKHLQLAVHLTAKHHEVLGDAGRLRQMFTILLQNAEKFTPAQGVVTAHSANDGEDIVVEIIDTGLGITAEDLPKIFLPFEQGGPAREHPDNGLGLGLTVAHAIVAAHEGQLTAASPGLNQGSTFRMCLNTKKHPDPLRIL